MPGFLNQKKSANKFFSCSFYLLASTFTFLFLTCQNSAQSQVLKTPPSLGSCGYCHPSFIQMVFLLTVNLHLCCRMNKKICKFLHHLLLDFIRTQPFHNSTLSVSLSIYNNTSSNICFFYVIYSSMLIFLFHSLV